MSDNSNELGNTSTTGLKKVKRMPPEVSILLVLAGIALVFEILGWYFVGESFLGSNNACPSSCYKSPSSASLLWV